MNFAGTGFFSAETSVETISMASGSVVVQNPGGSVLVQGWDRDVVRVSGTKNATSPPFSDRLDVVLERDGSTLTVVARGAHGTFDMVIDVPAEVGVVMQTNCGDVVVRGTSAPVCVKTVSGDIAIADVTGSVNVETQSGDVSVHSVRAPLTVVTASGDLVAELLHSAEITSGSGSISATVTWVREGQHFDARTASGDVAVRDALGCASGRVSVETESGAVSVHLDEAALFVRTQSGDIDVVVPRSLDGTVAAKSASGAVANRVALRALNASGGALAVREAIGADIDVESESGSIVLRYAEA